MKRGRSAALDQRLARAAYAAPGLRVTFWEPHGERPRQLGKMTLSLDDILRVDEAVLTYAEVVLYGVDQGDPVAIGLAMQQAPAIFPREADVQVWATVAEVL